MFFDFTSGLLLGSAIIGLIIYRWMGRREHSKIQAAREKMDAELRETQLAQREAHSKALNEVEQKRIEQQRLLEDREHKIKLALDEVTQKQAQLAFAKNRLDEQESLVKQEEAELKQSKHDAVKQRRLYQMKLHAVSQMDKSTAQRELMRLVEVECADSIQDMRVEKLGKTEKEINDLAQRTLLAAMQRITSRPMNNATATVITLPSEDLKGRIIGREGRNIRTFEQVTGTTLMIDETPDSVLVSCFDPVRREIARIALEALLKDGRIHPASIEEAVTKAESEMTENVIELGEQAVRNLRLGSVHPEIVNLVGKLHYRLSNNQNTLDHSIEVANICALIAAEIGLDSTLAKRAGLFHDIGKSIDELYDKSHAVAGAEVLKRHSEDPKVVNAVAAHHEEVEAISAYAGLVMVADALSAVRPGARTSSIEGFIERVRSIEEIAKEEPGVIDAYAIQAGREIRVIVEPEKVGEEASRQLARRLRKRIEEELHYPGSIRITVIREQRFTETAI